MPTNPAATVTIDESAGGFAGGTGYLTVIGCAAQSADITPRVFASGKAMRALHGYSQAADLIEMFINETGLPVIFVGLPCTTVGTVSAVVTGVHGTSVVAAAADTNGVQEEVNGTFTVTVGGTVGTAGIIATLSLDGGRTTQTVRLGTGTSYSIPYVGIKLTFGAGTLLAGDVVTFTSVAPMWVTTDLATAEGKLAAQPLTSRSWLLVGDVPDATTANAVVTQVNTYETSVNRYTYARINTPGQTTGEALSAYVTAMTTAFVTVDGQKRIDIGLGRATKLSPVTGWLFRRPFAWAATIREYQHDLQIPTYRKSDGPLSGWSLEDTNGNIVEYDERTVGGALAAKFSCFRTFANGPRGAFVALSLTRDTDGAVLSRTHNLAVANLASSVVQTETENAIGDVLTLKSDGTATEDSLQTLEARINSALQNALLVPGTEGPRASLAVWQASRTDNLSVVGATLNGTLSLELNGTVENIATVVRIDAAA